jgi:hypothetical protein
MWPECWRQNPVVLPGMRVETCDVGQCVDANGIEVVKGFVGGSPIIGGEMPLNSGL